jgi:hypothetical protein
MSVFKLKTAEQLRKRREEVETLADNFVFACLLKNFIPEGHVDAGLLAGSRQSLRDCVIAELTKHVERIAMSSEICTRFYPAQATINEWARREALEDDKASKANRDKQEREGAPAGGKI